MKEALIAKIEEADNETLQRVELAIEGAAIGKSVTKLFDTRGVPITGASFNFFRHEVFPKLDGDTALRIDQVAKMTQGKYFDLSLLLKNGNRGVVSLFDYTSVISAEAKRRMLSYIANDWSVHAVGRGEYYIHLLTANSTKGDSHDILVGKKKIEVKSNRSRFSSSGCITDLRVVISDMTKYIKFKNPSYDDVFEKFNAKTFEHTYRKLFPTSDAMAKFLAKFINTLYTHLDNDFIDIYVRDLYDGTFESAKLCLAVAEFMNYQNYVGFDHIILLDYNTGDCIVLDSADDVIKHQHHLNLNVAYNFEHNRGNSISWGVCR